MTSKSILRRMSDGKEFHVTFLAHWSDIAADDDSGETDCVKWYGTTHNGLEGSHSIF